VQRLVVNLNIFLPSLHNSSLVYAEIMLTLTTQEFYTFSLKHTVKVIKMIISTHS